MSGMESDVVLILSLLELTVKECVLNSAPESCELDPIPSKLLIECLDSILPALTDLFNSSLVSGIFPQCLKSSLVTPILKKRCLDHNDLNNYRPVSNLCLDDVRCAPSLPSFKSRLKTFLFCSV